MDATRFPSSFADPSPSPSRSAPRTEAAAAALGAGFGLRHPFADALRRPAAAPSTKNAAAAPPQNAAPARGIHQAPARAAADEDREALREAVRVDVDDARRAAALAPPFFALTASQANEAKAAPPVAEILPTFLRRIAWTGDGRSGTVRLEIGRGAYEGVTVVVHADGGAVRVELDGKNHALVEQLRSRLEARLRARGLELAT